jgi:DNA-binding NarL/FixJ family response regulator
MRPTIPIPDDGTSPDDVIVLGDTPARRHEDHDHGVIRVLVVHGEGLVRACLRALLEAEHDISVSGHAADGAEALVLAYSTLPNVVLIDIRLAGLDGLQVTHRIVRDPRLSDVKVLVLGAPGSDTDLFGALRAGATGFLVRDTEPRDLLRAVRTVGAGDALLSPSVTRRVIEEFAAQPDPHRPPPEQLADLAAREREVLALVAMGLSKHEIAARLVVSPATVKTHVSRTMLKLDARDRAKLVALAYQTGLVQPDQLLAAPATPPHACALAAA